MKKKSSRHFAHVNAQTRTMGKISDKGVEEWQCPKCETISRLKRCPFCQTARPAAATTPRI